MLEFNAQTSGTLHQEHMAVAGFLKKLAAQLLNYRAGQPPDPADSLFNVLLGDLIAVVETELGPHFKFEEDELFPILTDAGAADMCTLFQEEHDVIWPLAARLSEQARSIRRVGHTVDGWNRFRRDGLELAASLSGHIAKEEMGLVPMLDEILEQEQDMFLAEAYASMR